MSASSQSASTSGESLDSADGIPWGVFALATLSFLLLAVTTIFGALASNARAGAHIMERSQRDQAIAEELGLDVAAIRRGRDAYMETCTACHGANGEAKPNLGKALRGSAFIQGKSDSQLLMFLKLGRNTWDAENTTGVAMPPKGGNPMLQDDDLRDIAQFLLSLQAD